MVWNAKRQWKMTALLFLVLILGAWPAGAQELGDWSGSFAEGSADYFEYDMDVPMDGTVVITTTADLTLKSDDVYISVRDAADQSITFTSLLTLPATLSFPLAQGSFVVRIYRTQDLSGFFNIKAELTPANPGATEVENNDVIGAANSNPDNLFAGAIGHWRTALLQDRYDYYSLTLTEDTNVHFDLTTAATLTSFSTYLSLKNASDVTMTSTSLFEPDGSWDVYLAPGTYYLRLYIGLTNLYGGYTIATTTTPAAANSSETEINDTLAAANPIRKKTLYGSIGYYRDKSAGGTEFYDNFDYFSCQVTQGGTLSAEIFFDDTLNSTNNIIRIMDANDISLEYEWLSGSPKTVTVNDLAAGTYYIRVGRTTGHGAYQINVSGNVFIPSPGAVGSIIFPLLLTD